MATDLRTVIAVRRSPNVVVAVTMGIGYLSLGVIALAVRIGAAMASSSDHAGDGTGWLVSVAYVGLGLILLLGVSAGWANQTNTVVGASYVLVGLALDWLPEAGPSLLALNHPDNVVHLATAALLFGFGRTQD